MSNKNRRPPHLQQQQQVVSQQQHVLRTGPIPDPDTLRGYQQIDPGLVNRIVVMAEEQSKHRQAMEKRSVNSESINSIAGIISGTIISIVFGVLSYLTIISGQPIAGSILGSGTLASVVGTFIYGTRKKPQ